MKEKLKIVFVGTPDMAPVCLEGLIKNGFDIIAVVPPLKSHGSYLMFKNFVEEKNLKLFEFNSSVNEKEYIEKIKSLEADIGVVCSYDVKLSNDFLNTTKLGYINCHPSLLPQYRGGIPYFHIINNNEKISGITLHFMDSGFDTGDIIYQKQFEILPYETLGTLFNRTNHMFSEALIKVLGDIQNGVQIAKISQDKEKKFKKAPAVNGYFKINWSTNVEEIESLIRACNPFYCAYCYFRGLNMKIIKAHKIIKKHDFEYGKIVKASKKELLVASCGGFISLDVMQVGTWGVFLTDDFYELFKPNESEYLK